MVSVEHTDLQDGPMSSSNGLSLLLSLRNFQDGPLLTPGDAYHAFCVMVVASS